MQVLLINRFAGGIPSSPWGLRRVCAPSQSSTGPSSRSTPAWRACRLCQPLAPLRCPRLQRSTRTCQTSCPTWQDPGVWAVYGHAARHHVVENASRRWCLVVRLFVSQGLLSLVRGADACDAGARLRPTLLRLPSRPARAYQHYPYQYCQYIPTKKANHSVSSFSSGSALP